MDATGGQKLDRLLRWFSSRYAVLVVGPGSEIPAPSWHTREYESEGGPAAAKKHEFECSH